MTERENVLWALAKAWPDQRTVLSRRLRDAERHEQERRAGNPLAVLASGLARGWTAWRAEGAE